jgi:PAS domain-containing protein
MPPLRPLARRRAREQADDLRPMLTAVLECVGAAALTCGRDGSVTGANRLARELLAPFRPVGAGPAAWVSELRPRTPSGIPMPEEDLPQLRALQGEVVHDVDVRLQLAGADKVIEAIAWPVSREDGATSGAVLLLEDVGEIRRAEAATRRAGR